MFSYDLKHFASYECEHHSAKVVTKWWRILYTVAYQAKIVPIKCKKKDIYNLEISLKYSPNIISV